MDEPSWDDYADSWDDDEDVRRYSSLAFESLDARVLASLPRTTRVLDFGCGTGLLSTRLAERFDRVVALDVSPKMVQALDDKLRTRSLANVVTTVGDIEDATFQSAELADESFDLIVASSVCAFLTSFEDAVKRLSRLLTPEGVFVQWDWLATPDDDFGFTPERIRTAYDAAGLHVARVASEFSLEGKRGTLEVLMGIGHK